MESGQRSLSWGLLPRFANWTWPLGSLVSPLPFEDNKKGQPCNSYITLCLFHVHMLIMTKEISLVCNTKKIFNELEFYIVFSAPFELFLLHRSVYSLTDHCKSNRECNPIHTFSMSCQLYHLTSFIKGRYIW